jgi:RimJ/RimL family protein N-acetyltransferase
VPERVRLRPVAEDDLASLERTLTDPDLVGEFLWGGWRNPTTGRRAWQENGLLDVDRSVLMVIAGEERIGFVAWRRNDAQSAWPCWEIGISLWPEARGQGYGTEAQRQPVRYLFLHTQYNRVQALTDVDNIAEQRSLEKAGFTREGVLRGYRFRAGRWRDEVIYGVVRADVRLD